MPIPYETLHYWIHQRELHKQTVSSVLAINRCGGKTSNSESFIPNDGVQGASDRGPDRGKCINPRPWLPFGLSSSGNSGGSRSAGNSVIGTNAVPKKSELMLTFHTHIIR